MKDGTLENVTGGWNEADRHMKQYNIGVSLDQDDKIWPIFYSDDESRWKIGVRRNFIPLSDVAANVFMWYDDALSAVEIRNLYNVGWKGFSGAQHSLLVLEEKRVA